MGAVTCWETLGTKKEEQAPGKAREGQTASPGPSPHCQICEEFRSISRKIYEKPNSIEELAELREWMKGIPEKLVGLQVRWVHEGRGPGAGVQEPGGWRSGGYLGGRGVGGTGLLFGAWGLGDQEPGGWK